MIRNVDDAKISKEESRGANPKIWLWLENEDEDEVEVEDEDKGSKKKKTIREGLFKPTYVRADGTNTQTHFGEAIYSDICTELLHFPCADIELAERRGEIGCISYNVLEKLPNPEGKKDKYKLTDFVALIQRIRPKGLDKNLDKVKESQEYYSLDLINEAIDDYIQDPAKNKEYKDYVLKLCLIDSSLNYFDRHAMNLAVAEDRTTYEKYVPGTFDNGTTLSLGIRKEELQQYLNRGQKGIADLRKLALSKIGVSTEAPITFDRLETMIFNHQFDQAEPLYREIQRDLDIEKVKELLQNEKYDDLDPIYKEAIIKQIQFNKEMMQVRFEKANKRSKMEKCFNSEVSFEEMNDTLYSYFKPAFFNMEMPIIDKETYDDLMNIKDYRDELDQRDGIVFSPANKNIAQWSLVIGSIMKKMDSELSDESKKQLIRKYMIEEFDFCKKDLDQIDSIVDFYEKKIDEPTPIATRNFIYGTKSKKGLGEENVKPFLLIKFAESQVSEEHNERYRTFVENYRTVLENEQLITDYVPTESEKGKIFKQVGITDQDEEYRVLYDGFEKIKAENRRFNSTDDFREFMRETARETLSDCKENIGGYLIDRDIKECLDENTYILPDKSKVTIMSEPLKNAEALSYMLGSKYFVSIGSSDKGQTCVIAAREGEEILPDLISAADKLIEKNGLEKTDYRKSIKGNKRKKKSKYELRSGDIISIGVGKQTVKGLQESPDEIRKFILGEVRAKSREEYE